MYRRYTAILVSRIMRLAVTIMLALIPSVASGQSKEEAERLFDEAKALIKVNMWNEACPKLERSNEIDPARGTRYWLARCYADTSRLALAWSMFIKLAEELDRAASGETDVERIKQWGEVAEDSRRRASELEGK